MIDLNTLKSLLDYDANTGVFTRKVSRGCRAAGSIAGNVGNHGYLQLAIQKRMYLAHRVAVFYMTGAWPSEVVDHIDGDKTNNRWPNLRQATPAQNARNCGLRSNNQSGFKGVSWNAKRRRWYAFIQDDAGQHYLGSFETPDAAHSAYAVAAAQMHGEFARVA